jgi:hypothetical protein
MADWLERLEALTRSVYERLELVDYEELSAFVTQRELIIQEGKSSFNHSPLSSVYRKKVDDILAMDSKIVGRMEQLKQEAAVQLGKLSTARSQRSSYERSIENNDGLFFDTRK